jgi:hypothetical protein
VAEERANAEERRLKREAEREVEREQNYEFLRYIKMQLAALARIEHFKESLASHKFYGVNDMFAHFDEGNKGYVTLEDFEKKSLANIDAQRFFELSGATEKGLTYR